MEKGFEIIKNRISPITAIIIPPQSLLIIKIIPSIGAISNPVIFVLLAKPKNKAERERYIYFFLLSSCMYETKKYVEIKDRVVRYTSWFK